MFGFKLTDYVIVDNIIRVNEFPVYAAELAVAFLPRHRKCLHYVGKQFFLDITDDD